MSKAKETHLWFEKGDHEIQIESYSKKLIISLTNLYLQGRAGLAPAVNLHFT